jgi:hypothetical protein
MPGSSSAQRVPSADLLRHGSQLQILAYDAKTLLKTVRVLLRAIGK